MARDIDAAVRAAQLYHGCFGVADIRAQQRLYTTMMRKIDTVAKKHGVDRQDAYEQITAEARRRGGLCPIPGKDI